MEADELRKLIIKRLGLGVDEYLACPRQKTFMTPCAAADGDICMLENKTCVGCGVNVPELLEKEKTSIEMKDSTDWIEFEGDQIRCKICGELMDRGIITVSGHWAKCQGKETMIFLNKLADMTRNWKCSNRHL